MATAFIYALCEPGTRSIRYIGKTNNLRKRIQSHLNTSIKTETRLGRWLRSLDGEKPSLVILREVPAYDLDPQEMLCIEFARALDIDIVNGTDGGDGGFVPASQTPEANAKRSAKMKGRRPSDATLAAGQTPEAKAKRSASLKGRRPSDANLAATQTPEAKAKRRASKLGVPLTPEHCANISAGKKGKVTEAMLAAVRDPEICAKRSIEMTGSGNRFFGHKHTEESKAIMRLKRATQDMSSRRKVK